MKTRKEYNFKESLNENRSAIGMALLFIVPLILMFSQNEVYEEPIYIAITLTILLFLEGAMLLLTNNFVIPVLVTGTLFELLYLINDIVFQCRGNYLKFSDFLCAGVAFSVAGRYSISFSNTMLRCLIAEGLLVLISVILLRSKIYSFSKAQGGRIRGAIILILSLATLLFVDLSPYMGYYYYFDELKTKYGLVGTLFTEMCQTGVEKPSNYNEDEIESYLASMGMEDIPQIRPNIIVIMDEAFADYSLLGNLDTNIDPLPYIHSIASGDSLKGNITYGKVVTPVWGGTTVNTEWEFLTGMSNRLCPSSIPFLQFPASNYDYDLVNNLKAYGYKAYAFHPYYEAGYNRRGVYSDMGFDDMTFIEQIDSDYENMGFDERPSDDKTDDSEDGMYVRNLISDTYDVEYVIDWYENNKGNEPLFMFNVTMQNHGPYNLSGYESDIKLTKNIVGKHDIEQYLSILKETDKAVQKLIEYFELVDDPTIILIFGDHQPNLNEDLYHKIFNADALMPEQEYKKYYTPCIMYSNYEASMPEEDEISANFLAARLLDVAGIPKNAWFAKNAKYHDAFKVFSPFAVIDSEGAFIENLSNTQVELSNEYSGYMYYFMK